MRVSLETYLHGGKTDVFSLVVEVPFSPIDLDLGLLARGEWDSVKDRFRIWFLPKIEGQNDTSLCYVTVRKLDQKQEVLVYMHIVVNLGAKAGDGDGQSNFTVGILSNDDIRARATLGVILGIPPVFHKVRDQASREKMEDRSGNGDALHRECPISSYSQIGARGRSV